MTRFQEIANEVLSWDSVDRAELAGLLVDSLTDPEPRNPATGMTAEIEAAWMEEVERRWKEIEDGTAEVVPVEKVLKEMRERFESFR